LTGSGIPVAVALARDERRLIEGLRRAGAVNAGAARPLESRGSQVDRLEKLLEAGVILQAAPGVYYVDETAYQRYQQGKRVGVLAVVAVLLLVGLLLAIRALLL
jgi:hypothetical protein